jgi:hypothetical protein
MGVTSGTGTTYPFGSPEFTPVLSGVRVTRSLVLFVYFVDRCLSFFPFAFGHYVVCPPIYGFWSPLWYFQTLLTLERIYTELPVLSAHLDRPFRVPSAMCPRFLVVKLMYPMPINRWLWEICVHVLKWIFNRSCRRYYLGSERANLFLKWHSLQQNISTCNLISKIKTNLRKVEKKIVLPIYY